MRACARRRSIGPVCGLTLILTAWSAVAGAQESAPADEIAEDRGAASRPLGAPAAFARGERESLLLEPGTVLHGLPEPTSSVERRLPGEEAVEVEVLERRRTSSGEWARVRWADAVGWVRERERAVERVAAILEQPERMARRQRLIGLARAEVAAEPWATTWALRGAASQEAVDVTVHAALPRDVRRRVRDLVACFPALYARRIGNPVVGRTLPVELFVFPEGRYERFVEVNVGTVVEESGGLELDGVILLDAPQFEAGFLGTLAHELAHVLNRYAFSERPAPVWIEEGIAEDLAHSVEAAFVVGRDPCGVPGGWARTEVRRESEFVDAEHTVRTDLRRTSRARMVACYPGPAPDDPDVRTMDRLQFAGSFRREFLYFESLLLLRDLLDSIPPDGALDALRRWDAQADRRRLDAVVDRLLGPLVWRQLDSVLMSC